MSGPKKKLSAIGNWSLIKTEIFGLKSFLLSLAKNFTLIISLQIPSTWLNTVGIAAKNCSYFTQNNIYSKILFLEG